MSWLSHKLTPWLGILLLLLFTACDDIQQPQLQALSQDAVILAFGDSLTYGTGANHQAESYPAVLAELSGRTVINAGVPGELSSEGLIRIRALLEKHQPELVLLCHGGNDLIRKLDENQIKQNLTEMISLIRQHNAQVVMLSVPKPGMFLKAASLYREVADSLQVPLENDIIPDIESQTSLKADAIHPNAEGYRLLAERVHQLLDNNGAF